MAGNDTPEKRLTPKQNEIIALLLTGNSLAMAAQKAGVAHRTAQRWQNLPQFQRTLKEKQDKSLDDKLSFFERSFDAAAVTLARNMGKDAPAGVQVRVAMFLMDKFVDMRKLAGLESKISDLEELLRQWKG